jgi:3'-5' exoribonuclease
MRVYVCDLAEADAVDQPLLVREKQVRTNRNGNAYLQLELMDRTGAISARYWNVGDHESKSFETGDFLFVRGKVQMFQGQLQLIVSGFKRCDVSELDLAEFVPSCPKDLNVLTSDLRAALGKVKQPHLRTLVQTFLADDVFMRKLTRAPAGVRNHHAYIGGLLEHVVTLLKVYDRIADLYPELDPDMMRLGIFLHDVGKLRELQFERDFSYSDEGQLLGHLVLGVEILTEKLSETAHLLGEPVPQPLVDHLKHLIVSHHGTLEFGSPRLPMTAEAVALHHLDNLDAKTHSFSRAIKDDLNGDARWTAFDPKMNRKLFKAGQPTTVATPPRSWSEGTTRAQVGVHAENGRVED